jgi:hypothetical protein
LKPSASALPPAAYCCFSALGSEGLMSSEPTVQYEELDEVMERPERSWLKYEAADLNNEFRLPVASDVLERRT